MPNKNGKGPKGQGPKDGRGGGRGRGVNKPTGVRTGGQRGKCKPKK